MKKKHAMKIVESDCVPINRVYANGAKARLSNFRVKCEENPDGSIKIVKTADVEYDPVYIAVIQLD